ncbi:DUF6515 family protein [Microbulbifer sp. GL-2]|uniref:DUF6515 family protein n=1 Tax=Microbulbifer sp. GL-2 TaxID=2591606 RepID=UPI001163308D|nr:DUF6515 family protein [Microbulbifer sp. GL-2]BBM00902.1 hypothetical protein GL2_09760 [Microbulbifer sp. GL-2]
MRFLFALLFLTIASATLAETQVERLPDGARLIEANDEIYFYVGGYFYRQGPDGYTRVEPPLGARVPEVATGTSFFLDGKDYRRAGNGTFFQFDPKDNQYVVVTPPNNWRNYGRNPLAPEVRIYPRAYPPKYESKRRVSHLRSTGNLRRSDRNRGRRELFCQARAANLVRSVRRAGRVSVVSSRAYRRQYLNCMREYGRRRF